MSVSRCPGRAASPYYLPLPLTLGLLWLATGVLLTACFPALRGAQAGLGWMPLYLLLMPLTVIVSLALRGSGMAVAERRSRPRRRLGAQGRQRRTLPTARRLLAAALLLPPR